MAMRKKHWNLPSAGKKQAHKDKEKADKIKYNKGRFLDALNSNTSSQFKAGCVRQFAAELSWLVSPAEFTEFCAKELGLNKLEPFKDDLKKAVSANHYDVLEKAMKSLRPATRDDCASKAAQEYETERFRDVGTSTEELAKAICDFANKEGSAMEGVAPLKPEDILREVTKLRNNGYLPLEPLTPRVLACALKGYTTLPLILLGIDFDKIFGSNAWFLHDCEQCYRDFSESARMCALPAVIACRNRARQRFQEFCH
jgi:hypothetical protein